MRWEKGPGLSGWTKYKGKREAERRERTLIRNNQRLKDENAGLKDKNAELEQYKRQMERKDKLEKNLLEKGRYDDLRKVKNMQDDVTNLYIEFHL